MITGIYCQKNLSVEEGGDKQYIRVKNMTQVVMEKILLLFLNIVHEIMIVSLVVSDLCIFQEQTCRT